MTTLSHSGGCQCGAVRYRVSGALGYPHLCHCRMCQKAAGNYFMPLGSVARANFALTRGEPAWFQSSDAVRRGFCETCGTPLFYDAPAGDQLNIVLGSLDDPASVEPVVQSSVATKLPWFHKLDGLAVEPQEASADWLASLGRRYQHLDHDTAHWPPEDTNR